MGLAGQAKWMVRKKRAELEVEEADEAKKGEAAY